MIVVFYLCNKFKHILHINCVGEALSKMIQSSITIPWWKNWCC